MSKKKKLKKRHQGGKRIVHSGTSPREVHLETLLIGECPVDSGQLLIVDPCYLREWQSGEFGEPNNYSECCNTTLKFGAGPVFNNRAVAAATAFGDGIYPIYANLRNGIPISLEIRFDEGPLAGLAEIISQRKS